MDSRTNMQCLLRIDTQSGGWEKCLSKMLKKIKGANYALDVQDGTLCISGKVNPAKVLKKLKKAGKAAEILWVATGSADLSAYFEDPTLYSNHYNPYNSDYSFTSNGYAGGYYPSSSSSYSHHHQLPISHHYPYGGYAAGFGGLY